MSPVRRMLVLLPAAARLAETRGEGWRVLTRTEAGGYPYGCFVTAEPPG